MDDDRQKVNGTKQERRWNWTRFDVTPEIVILAVTAITIFMADKDISNVAIGGLIGYLAKKANP
jgi:hypothetical protein